MATVNTIDGDVVVRGNLRTTTINLPATCVGDSNVNGSAPITAAKLQHQYEKTFAQVNGSAATAERRVLHVAYGATGTIIAFRVGAVTAATGDSTATVDLRKNGTTILSAAVVIDNTKAAFAKTLAALATTGYVTGDVFEVVVTISAGTGTLPQGLFADFVATEDAA